MGNRPSSTIIYGFTWTEYCDDPEPDVGDDRLEEWKQACHRLGGVFGERPDGVTAAYQSAAKDDAVRQRGSYVGWGYLDEPCHAIGFTLAKGDWDAEVELSPLVAPHDSETLLRLLCEFHGVPYQEPRFLMLSSYG